MLFYLLPLESAYGWFTALHVALAGINTYLLARALRLRPRAALVAGLAFMFSGFLIVSVVFTMFLAAIVWLPLLLATIEIMVHKQEEKGAVSFTPIPYLVLGAVALGLTALAGHPELIYYAGLVAGAFAAVRLVAAALLIERRVAESPPTHQSAAGSRRRTAITIVKLGLWLLALVPLGLALGAVQLIPLLELLPLNFRDGSATLAQVREWAWPSRHVLTFLLPDIFGNPSHHRWFDIWARQWRPVSENALSEPVDTLFWGIKNYVEGGNYLGIVVWLLAAVAVVQGGSAAYRGWRGKTAPTRKRPSSIDPLQGLRPVHLWFFAGLAAVSLLFAFGTPLYALLYYGLPGWNQLHSPFRWVFPFTLSMALLAGGGLQGLTVLSGRPARPIAYGLAWLSIAAGLLASTIVLLSLLAPDFFIQAGQRAVDNIEQARVAFRDGRMFWSYQAANLLRFGLFALLGGAAVLGLLWARRGRRCTVMTAALLVVLMADLWGTHGHFNPAASTMLNPLEPAGAPPAVAFLNAREAGSCGLQPGVCAPGSGAPWRFTTFNRPGEKTFNANVGMYYGWHDIRGYDSIIARQYVELMTRIAPQDDELLYNKIAPLYSNVTGDVYAILDNPLLDLLNVKYVLTEHFLPNSAWTEIYRDERVGVYENVETLPRAFIVPEARVVPAAEQPLLDADLARMVYIEETPVVEGALTPGSPQLADANISRYTVNDVFVDVNLSDRGWLVLADAYFPGWKAFIRPFGAAENQERELEIYRANGGLRTVYLAQDGQWTVRFVYTPMSFKLGLYASFIAGMTLLLLLLYWAWGRYYQPESIRGDVRTVAKNSLVPMLLNLSNKAIDFAFAMLYVRILGPEGTGKYYFVVAIYGIFEIVSRYGLGTLLTRDVAADKERSSRYLTNVIGLRTLLWLAILPVIGAVTWFYANIGGGSVLDVESIGRQEVQAIAILTLAMLFANWSDGLSSSFNAFEKMEYPAGLASAMAILKVSLGAAVLLLGWGFVGLAGVALVVNIIQVVWLFVLLRVTLFRPEWRWDWALQWWMLRTSGPLMINHLLSTIFWRIDVWILRPLAGAASVGLYSIGLKYLDGLNIIPSVFTMAVFPLMSRYARSEGDTLLRSYVVSVRLLVILSLPVATAVTFLAEPLVWLVGGSQYLGVPETLSVLGRTVIVDGGADLAMQVIIWSIPIGFVNSVTQYVLISVNQQHFLTRAFIIGVVFNTAGNLLLIPRFGYLGAAFVTILSEFSLLFPFHYSVRRNVGPVPWVQVFLPATLAALAMGVVIYALVRTGINVWPATVVGLAVYGVGLVLAGGLRGRELAFIAERLSLSRGDRRVGGS